MNDFFAVFVAEFTFGVASVAIITYFDTGLDYYHHFITSWNFVVFL